MIPAGSSGVNGTVQQPVVRPPGPDRLDECLRVRTSLSWLGLSVAATGLVAALVWSCLSTAAVKVDGHGILMTPDAVVDVPAITDGRLDKLDVEVGTPVKAGQIVAEVADPEAQERLRNRQGDLDSLREERELIIRFQERLAKADEQLSAERELSLKTRIETLTQRASQLAELEANIQDLYAKRIATRDRLLQVQIERTRNDNDLAEARGGLLQMISDEKARETQNAKELLINQTKISALERDIALLVNSRDRATNIRAPVDGRISEVAATKGEIIKAGSPLLRILPEESSTSELIARIYVPGGNGKRIKVGMSAQVVPSTARVQRDGFIDGIVTQVAVLPTTPESIQNTLKNSALVHDLTTLGPAYEVLVHLQTDPSSASGYRWSTGWGTSTPPNSGTIADAKFVIDRIPLIALVIPRSETVLNWLRTLL